MGRKKIEQAYDMGYRHGRTDGRDEGYLAGLDDADLMGLDEVRRRFEEPAAQPSGSLTMFPKDGPLWEVPVISAATKNLTQSLTKGLKDFTRSVSRWGL